MTRVNIWTYKLPLLSLKTWLFAYVFTPGDTEAHYGGEIDAFQGSSLDQWRRYWSDSYSEFLSGVLYFAKLEFLTWQMMYII